MSMEIEQGVYMVGGPDLSHDKDACIFLVDGKDSAVLIDAGAGIDRVVANIEAVGVDLAKVKSLVLTHCHVDHSGGVPGLKDRLGLQTICHKACANILAKGNDIKTAATWYNTDLPAMSFDTAFEGKEHRLDLDDTELICLHTPGHSPGSISAIIDDEIAIEDLEQRRGKAVE